jgi:hypothetical protein
MFPHLHTVVFVAGGSLAGVGISLLSLLWGKYYTTLTPAQIPVATVGSFLLAQALSGLIMIDNQLVTSLVVIAPLLQALALGSRGKSDVASKAFVPAKTVPSMTSRHLLMPSLNIGLILLITSYAMSFGFFKMILSTLPQTFAADSTPLILLCSAVPAAILLLGTILFQHRLDIDLIYRFALPILAIGMFSLSLSAVQGGTFAWAVIVAGNRCVDLLV